MKRTILILFFVIILFTGCTKQKQISPSQPPQASSPAEQTPSSSPQQSPQTNKTEGKSSVKKEEFEQLYDTYKNSDNEEERQKALEKIDAMLKEAEKNSPKN